MKRVILYGAGNNAEGGLKHVRGLSDFSPICFCDSSDKYVKEGLQCCGLPVIHRSRLREYGEDVYYYITPKPPISYEIQNMLVQEENIKRERIINYEDDISEERYYSCPDLRRVAIIGDKGISLCCDLGENLRSKPLLQEYCLAKGSGIASANSPSEPVRTEADQGTNSYDIALTVKRLLEKRKQLLTKLREGGANSCSNCPSLRKDYWKETADKIEVLAISPSVPCQLACIYCNVCSNARNIADNRELVEKAKNIDVVEIVKELERQNALDIKEPVQLSSGELTINPRKKEILDYMQKYPLQIFTNAVIYDEQLESLTCREGSLLFISIDAGTRETYKLVKGIETYDRVIDNIRRYKRAGSHIQLKYIIISENCSTRDIDGFMDFCRELKPELIIISTDLYYDHSRLPAGILEGAAYMARRAKEYSLGYNIASTFSRDNIEKINEMVG